MFLGVAADLYKGILLHPEMAHTIMEDMKKEDMEDSDSDAESLWEEVDVEEDCGCVGPGYIIQDATAEDVERIKNSLYIEGDTNAPISIVEYSDIGCHACVTHYHNGTVASLLEAFSGQVNYSYKPIDIGYEAVYQSAATMCAGKLQGEEAYIQMYKRILDNATESSLPNEQQID